jgi:pyruvate/2-oxoglutarate dehydrogenase complex dihydrolipoamide acyltransferase (E2) component
MEMGNISKWHVDVGGKFSEGNVLVEIETDKATMDFVIEEDGVLAKILKDSGAKDIPVGTVSNTAKVLNFTNECAAHWSLCSIGRGR